MKNRFLFLLIILSIGCEKIETSLTNNMLYVLNKPLTDTLLQLDTFLMGTPQAAIEIPQPVIRYTLHNKTANTLLIREMYLHKKKESPFIININGRPDDNHNLKITSGDSIALFVSVKQSVKGNLTDSLVIQSDSELPLYCPIIGYALQCTIIDSLTDFFQLQYTFGSQEIKSYIVRTTIKFPKTSRVKILAGSHFYFWYNTKFVINGNLSCIGTLQNPIRMRQFRFNNAFYEKLPGQWQGLELNGSGNVIKHTHIMNAQNGITLENDNKNEQWDSILYTVLKYCSNGIKTKNSNYVIGNSLITHSKEVAIKTYGGKSDILFSTLVKSAPNNKYSLIYLSNQLKENENLTPLPITQFKIENCILFEENSNVINLNKNEAYPFHYEITNTLHNIPEVWIINNNSNNIIHSLYGDPQFVDKNSDFNIQPISPARKLANNAWRELFHDDLTGKIRNPDTPTAGCFE